MKTRIIWFAIFYIILGIFVCYNLVYLGVIWSNKNLLDLYNNGFKVSGVGVKLFDYSSAFAVYGLPTLGALFSWFGFTAAILSQSFLLKSSTPKSKLIALVTSFIVLIIGFYLNFIGQLFYDEWNDDSVMISTGGEPVAAKNYYTNWMSLVNIWIIFAVFFVLFIICIIIIIKLYFLNIQWLKYDKKESTDEMNLEITSPFPGNLEFDPNETQTITLSIDTDKISAWKNPKKKDKIKKKKNTKKK